jgi:hypothetical protein
MGWGLGIVEWGGRLGVARRDGEGRGNMTELILGHDGSPPRPGGPVSKMHKGPGSLCPRGSSLLCYDGQPEGGGDVSAWSKERRPERVVVYLLGFGYGLLGETIVGAPPRASRTPPAE